VLFLHHFFLAPDLNQERGLCGSHLYQTISCQNLVWSMEKTVWWKWISFMSVAPIGSNYAGPKYDPQQFVKRLGWILSSMLQSLTLKQVALFCLSQKVPMFCRFWVDLLPIASVLWWVQEKMTFFRLFDFFICGRNALCGFLYPKQEPEILESINFIEQC
jgi:hypothetical protein